MVDIGIEQNGSAYRRLPQASAGMKFWRGLDLGTQVGRGSEQKPAIRLGTDGNLSLAPSFPLKPSGAKSTTVRASAIPLRKRSASGRPQNLHPHAGSLAAGARSFRFLLKLAKCRRLTTAPSRRKALQPKLDLYLLFGVEAVCSPALGAATGPGRDSEIAARFPEKREGNGRYPLLVRTLYFFR